MTPCASCGGTQAAQELIRAKGLVNRMLDSADPQKVSQQQQSLPENNRVRLEFIGDRIGATSYTVNGRTYRAGNNPLDKYLDVAPEDVAHLERLGVFRRIYQRPTPQAPTSQAGTPIPAAPEVPTPTPQEILMKAREDFEEQQKIEDARIQAALAHVLAEPVVEKAVPAVVKPVSTAPVKKSPASKRMPTKK